jgi:hypothetical protein
MILGDMARLNSQRCRSGNHELGDMAMTDIKGPTEINRKPANLGDRIDISWLAYRSNNLDDEINSIGDNVFDRVIRDERGWATEMQCS